MPLSYHEALGFVRQLNLTSLEISILVGTFVFVWLLTFKADTRRHRWTKMTVSLAVVLLVVRKLTESADKEWEQINLIQQFAAVLGYCVILALVWVDDITHYGAILFHALIDSPDNRTRAIKRTDDAEN